MNASKNRVPISDSEIPVTRTGKNENIYSVGITQKYSNTVSKKSDANIEELLQLSKIGIVQLDNELCLQRYTSSACQVFNLSPQDIGRPIDQISIKAAEHNVLRLVQQVSQLREAHETQVVVDDDVFLLKINPYNYEEDQPAGVLASVIDITELKQEPQQLAQIDVQYEDIVANADSFFVRWEAETGKIIDCNQFFALRWGSTVQNLIGKNIINLRQPEERESFHQSLLSLKPNEASIEIYTMKTADGSASSAHTFTQALSKDGLKVDEYQTNGYDCTEEQKYKVALDNLFSVFTDESLIFQQKLKHLLAVGLDYYRLDTALVSMVSDSSYEVKCVCSKKPGALEVGTQLQLSDSFCGHLIEEGATLAIDNLSISEFHNLPCYKETGIESFIGTCIHTVGGPYGTVSFSATHPRRAPVTREIAENCG